MPKTLDDYEREHVGARTAHQFERWRTRIEEAALHGASDPIPRHAVCEVCRTLRCGWAVFCTDGVARCSGCR